MIEFVQLLLGGLVIGSIYGLIAIGFTAIFNATGIVNFAQGDFAALGALSAAAAYRAGLPLLWAALLAVLLVAVIAMAIERLALRRTRQDVARGMVVTIGIGVVLQGTMALFWGTDAYPLPSFSGEAPLEFGGATIPTQALWVLGTAAALMLLLTWFLRRTYIGKLFRACSINPLAATLVGVRIRTVSTLSFGISGALGALAGIVVAPITLAQFDGGLMLGLKGFVACIIGGFGNPLGAAIGGLLLGTIEALTAGYLSSGYKNAIAFCVMLVFLLLRPGGILGEMESAKR